MKKLLSLTFLLFSTLLFAQKPCEYSANVSDSIGTFKETRDYIMSEKHFGSSSSYIFFALQSTDGMPSLKVQVIQKSKDFISVNCFDKSSRIVLQLTNGKIVTFLHLDQENCGTLIHTQDQTSNRVTTGNFVFMKGSIEDLKSAPISIMRIKYLTGTDDYVVKQELVSEMDGKLYEPGSYFQNYLKCIE